MNIAILGAGNVGSGLAAAAVGAASDAWVPFVTASWGV